MKKTTLLLLACLLVACSATKHATNQAGAATGTVTPPIPGADGLSFEKAIVIQETSEFTGVDAEYKWLKVNYPGYKTNSQELVRHEGKPYDVLTVTVADGTQKKIYFDISNYYGKM